MSAAFVPGSYGLTRPTRLAALHKSMGWRGNCNLILLVWLRLGKRPASSWTWAIYRAAAWDLRRWTSWLCGDPGPATFGARI